MMAAMVVVVVGRCFRFEGAHELRRVCRHRCDATRRFSRAQGEGPLQLEYSSRLNTAARIVLSSGAASAFWASSAMSQPHLQAEEGANLVRKKE